MQKVKSVWKLPEAFGSSKAKFKHSFSHPERIFARNAENARRSQSSPEPRRCRNPGFKY